MPRTRVLSELTATLFILGFLALPVLPDSPDSNSVKTQHGPAERIQRALDSPVTLHFADRPLTDVVKLLRAQYKIPVVLDRRSLDDAGVPVDTRVSQQCTGISLRSALDLMMRGAVTDIGFHARNEVLVLSSSETVEDHLVTTVYPVRDLILGRDESGEPISERERDFDYDTLINLIGSIVDPASWDDGTGPCQGINPFRGTLVIQQSANVHRHIGALLTALRQARKQPSEPKEAARCQTIEVQDTRAKQHILAALRTRTSVHFENTPLKDAMASLSQRYQIPVQFDRVVPGDRKMDPTAVVACQVDDISLQAALQLILEPLDLTWTILDEVVLITVSDETARYVDTRVYPVGDLVRPVLIVPCQVGGITDTPTMALVENMDDLISMITASIAPDSWSNMGLDAAIEPFGDSIVVSQTWPNHLELERLLARLRVEIAKYPPPPLPERADPDQLVLRTYSIGQLRAKDQQLPAESVAELVRDLLDPESWDAQGGKGLVRGLPGMLVVRHTIRMQKRVAHLLDQLGLAYGLVGGGIQ